jgi:O-glycosyl hydrolase
VGLAAVALLAQDTPGAAASRGAVRVSVDLRATRQTMQGFGSSDRVWIDPHLSGSAQGNVPPGAQSAILSSLYGRLGLTRVRPILDNGVQPTRGGPFEFEDRFTDAQIAYVKQAKRYGLRTFLPGPVYMEGWMTVDDVEAFVDWTMAELLHWRELGEEPKLWALLNEPEINKDFPPEWLHQVVRRLGPRMRRAGLKTELVVPDDENPVDAYRRAVPILADPDARRYVGALAYHIYKGGEADWARFAALAARYGLPVWMTEYDEPKLYASWPAALGWATAMSDLITVGGVSSVDYLFGFFGDWAGPSGAMITMHFDQGGDYRGPTYTPVYWLTGQFSRFVRPGYRRVSATTAGSGPRVSAYVGGRRVVAVAVNADTVGRSVRFVFNGGSVRGPVSPVRTSANEHWRSLKPLGVRGSSFVASLPRESVTTFVLHRAR